MNDYLNLLLGIICAGLGGELFVRGATGISHWARVAPGIVAATVLAFSTSTPELSVSLHAALAGQPRIGLGDALGSNVVNVALILGLATAISSTRGSHGIIRRDFAFAIAIPVFTILLSLDGLLSRWDGLLLLTLFILWLMLVGREARQQRQQDNGNNQGNSDGAKPWLTSGTGLLLLILAGRLIVAGSSGIAMTAGLDPFVIGVTVVAIGTSVPELATTLVAKFRGLDDISLGTVLGSNIFNGACIIGLTAFITPIPIPRQETSATILFGLGALWLSCPRHGLIKRRQGLGLLALYAAYLLILLSG